MKHIFKSSILLLFIATFFISAVYAQDHDHSHEEESVHHTDETVTASTNNTTGVITESQSATEEDGHGHSHGISCVLEANVNYNMPLRIGSIFIILATSAIGIFSPIILYRIRPYKEGSVRDWILTAGKFFGTGVIISTAFIHMLPEALELFESDCIGEGWHSYGAFGGLFCMIASFFLQVIELAALTNLDALARKNAAAAVTSHNNSSNTFNDGKSLDKAGDFVTPNQLEENQYVHNHSGINEDGHVHSAGFLEHDQSIRNIGTLILEFGIITHSIIIGITLGTTDTESFQTLFIALVFHQFFEGIALGTRINDLELKSLKKPIIMGVTFISMTPIGIAIGIGIRSSLNPSSIILAQAILDSLSAGILLYNAYVSLMSIEINHNTGFRNASLYRKVFCFLSMYVGAALMAILGKWA